MTSILLTVFYGFADFSRDLAIKTANRADNSAMSNNLKMTVKLKP